MHRSLVAILLVMVWDATTADVIAADRKATDRSGEDAFAKAAAARWKEVFFDPGTGDWKERWFLDGEVGQAKNGPNGMEITAGPEFKNDAHHMVLWTRDSFAGNLKIEYDYKSRILLHAGDVTTDGSFAQFRAKVLATRLKVSADKVEYEFGPTDSRLEVAIYDGDHSKSFSLPRINGKPIELRPTMTYQSLYLKGEFGSDEISVMVGPQKRLLDFSK